MSIKQKIGIQHIWPVLLVIAWMMTGTTALGYAAAEDPGSECTDSGEVLVLLEEDASAVLEAASDEGMLILPGEKARDGAAVQAGEAADQYRETAPVGAADGVADEPVVIQAIEDFDAGVTGTSDGMVLTLEDPAQQQALIDALEALPGVQLVQPNFTYRLFDQSPAVQQGLHTLSSGYFTDPYTSDQYYLGPWDSSFQSSCGANVTAAWRQVAAGDPVTIAVLDTGCDSSHADIYGNLDKAHAYNAITGKAGKRAAADLDGHGTHVAGIAGAVCDNGIGISGVSGNLAKILPIKVFEGTYTQTREVLAAYSYLEQLMDDGSLTNLHVINLSFGGYDDLTSVDHALEAAIARMRDRDVLTVCAGGNGDSDDNALTKHVFPGDYEDCLCVTSLDRDGTNSSFSDYNAAKDISAPGQMILSTMPDSAYAFATGTSMAAPVVSGICGILWADNPNLTCDQVEEAIRATAHPVNRMVNDRGSRTGSSGGIDAGAALQYAQRFETVRQSITGAKVRLSTTSYTYNGKAKQPAATVKLGSQTLKKNRDYVVHYINNKNPGTGTASISGIGAYKGTLKKTFRIVAKPAKKGTSIKKGNHTYVVTVSKQGAAEVSFRRTSNSKSVTIPASITVKKVTYKVTGIKSRAFSGKKKLRNVYVKSRHLRQSALRGALKGSKVQILWVDAGTSKQNSTYVKKYRRYFRKSVSGRRVSVYPVK